jgi:hypothetical protein
VSTDVALAAPIDAGVDVEPSIGIRTHPLGLTFLPHVV